jgi:peptide/nickel transport system substrate-binding protein
VTTKSSRAPANGRVALLPAAVLLAALFLSACATAVAPGAALVTTPTPAPSPTPARGAGDTLRILFWQAPTMLNPHLTTRASDWAAARVAYEPLASYDAAGQLIPFLAAEIPTLENGGVAADGQSVTWKLKQGVKWSDGEPFTADDVKFTHDYITDETTAATTAGNYAGIDAVEVVDNHTIKVTFKQVTPAWSIPFVGVQGLILPRHIFEPYKGEKRMDAAANMLPVGTGAYRAVRYKPEEVLFLGNNLIETVKVIYEPNPYFREPDKPHFSRVELKGGGTVDEAARSVLQVGDVDFANNLQIDAQTQQRLEAGGRGRILAPFGAFVERILLNRTDPNKATADGERSSVEFPHRFFSDLKVREAFALAIDRDGVAALYGRTGQTTSNVLVSPETFQSTNTEYVFDPERAERMLDEAGWVRPAAGAVREKDGVKLSVLFQTSANPVRQQTQALVKEDLEKAGVEVRLIFYDSSVFFASDPENTNTRHHFYADMQMYATGNRSPDPGAYMRNWLCEEIAQKANEWRGLNKERWCDPAYDELHAQSTTETDPERRRQLFIQMNDLLISDIAIIPLVRQADISGVSNTLQNVELTPWDADLWNIKDWTRQQADQAAGGSSE